MTREIAPHVFVETKFHGANVGYIVTGEGVILIDTPMLPTDARAWLQEIQRRTDQKILYIINTDHHRGHIIGDQYFPMATVIAHEYAWKNMKSYGDSFRTRLLNLYRDRMPDAVEEWKEHLTIVEPEITSVIYLPNDKLLFTGDLVITDRPPFLSQSNTKRWLQALTYVRKLSYDVMIPGHGEPCGKEATEKMSEFLRMVRREVRAAYRSGLSKADTARSLRHLIHFWPIPPFEKPKADRRFKSSLSRVWNEMKAEAQAKAKRGRAQGE
jgi:cyclase